VADEFDITLCQEMVVDHGVLSPLPLLNFNEGWGARIVPLAVNVVLHPLPTPARCWKLGEAIGRALESYPADERVIVVGTGGLSHQLTGPTFGDVRPDWDQQFMELLEREPQRLLGYTHEELIALGGNESVEVINWMAMRAALPSGAQRVHRTYYTHLIMGYGLIAFGVDRAA
jgi:protocatechuate 4,5-dioxygenase beta chain